MKTKVLMCWSSTLATCAMLVAVCPPASAQDAGGPPAVPEEELPAGSEVLAGGQVHEAFAKPVSMDPQAPILVPMQPPENLQEMPPAERPAGANIVWVPGYWAWDADRNDFVWVSGCWRNAPPNTYWVPGYWLQASLDGVYHPFEVTLVGKLVIRRVHAHSLENLRVFGQAIPVETGFGEFAPRRIPFPVVELAAPAGIFPGRRADEHANLRNPA